ALELAFESWRQRREFACVLEQQWESQALGSRAELGDDRLHGFWHLVRGAHSPTVALAAAARRSPRCHRDEECRCPVGVRGRCILANRWPDSRPPSRSDLSRLSPARCAYPDLRASRTAR